MKYLPIITLLVLTAVLSRLYGPTDAITIPLSGENRFWGVFIKDVIFWIEIVLAIALALDYLWVRYVLLRGHAP